MQITVSHKSIEKAEKLLKGKRWGAYLRYGEIIWDSYRILGTAKTGFKLIQLGAVK